MCRRGARAASGPTPRRRSARSAYRRYGPRSSRGRLWGRDRPPSGPRARTEVDRGPIDVLVNCAGHIAETPIERISDEEWDRMLRVHLGGTWHTCRATAPRMAARGRGSIVNVSSELALCGAEL